MKQLIVACVLTSMASQAPAQQLLSTASPIPVGAEERFCYYEGLAYSEDAFVLMVGDNTVTSTVNARQERLLRCRREEDGILKWHPQSTFSTSN